MSPTDTTHSTTTGMRCDLCGGTDFSIVSTADRHSESLQTGLCRGCGLVMHLPVPSEAEVAEYYATRYRQDYHGERVPNARRVMRAWTNGERIYRQLLPYLQGRESVFEIGAGIGCTVKAFETHGHPARGIEPNRDFNNYSREQLHTRIENNNLYDISDIGSPEVVLLIHVIEHFSSPRRALTHIHGLLADGGLFYVECPNLTGPFATYERMFHYAHIYNFTPETLEALAAECGFEKVAALSSADDPDIHMLFRKARTRPATAALGGHAASTQAIINKGRRPATAALGGHAARVEAEIRRHNALSYHLRPKYLRRRACKLWSYLMEALTAKGFVEKLLARLQNNAA